MTCGTRRHVSGCSRRKQGDGAGPDGVDLDRDDQHLPAPPGAEGIRPDLLIAKGFSTLWCASAAPAPGPSMGLDFRAGNTPGRLGIAAFRRASSHTSRRDVGLDCPWNPPGCCWAPSPCPFHSSSLSMTSAWWPGRVDLTSRRLLATYVDGPSPRVRGRRPPAQAVLVAAILGHLHAITSTGSASPDIMGSPVRRLLNPLPAAVRFTTMQGQTTDTAPTRCLTQERRTLMSGRLAL